MKAKYILVGLLMVALVMGGTGYSVSAGSGDKVTGGGRFDSLVWGLYQGDKVSFNLQVYLLDGGAADGKFQLINHDEGTKQTFSFSSYDVRPQGANEILELTGSIDGPDLYVEIREDAEPGFDSIQIWIGTKVAPPSLANVDYWGQVGKGNIQWHKAKVK